MGADFDNKSPPSVFVRLSSIPSNRRNTTEEGICFFVRYGIEVTVEIESPLSTVMADILRWAHQKLSKSGKEVGCIDNCPADLFTFFLFHDGYCGEIVDD